MKTFNKLLFLLAPNDRKNAFFLLIMMLVMALLETIGVASILPFMAVLTNPQLVETNLILNKMFQVSIIFGVENNEKFLFVLGVAVFTIFIISTAFKALLSYCQIRFIQMFNFTLSKRLTEGYLKYEYSWFLSRNSADLGKTILSEVNQVNGNGLSPLLELIAKGILTIILITLLILTNPKLALIVSLSLGGSYLIIFFVIKKHLNNLGEESLKNNLLRFKSINEVFGAVKEVKFYGLEQIYNKLFSKAAKIFAQTGASSAIISQLPRFILEIFTFGGVLLIILYMISQTGDFNNALPVISLYVFAGYRLMPALQQIYASFTRLTFVGPSLDVIYSELKNFKQTKDNQYENQDRQFLSFNKKITLNKINYKYPNSSESVLKDLNLNISAKSRVGFVGVTGSGKTTIADIILGLLDPLKGTLEVDGKIITEHNKRSWQNNIGYVPQQIYLIDDTISKNIAFGKNSNEINQEKVERASRIANLHKFVDTELPKKYNTIVGERGIRLSGGQRQRIGIARALYHNPKVLILDEATSSLDNDTEEYVMEAFDNLSKDITIILIAHRLNTIKKCDVIFRLDKGKIIAQGNFGELFNS
jgi:ATP-binding cassette, subfamily B, bacterial PglK